MVQRLICAHPPKQITRKHVSSLLPCSPSRNCVLTAGLRGDARLLPGHAHEAGSGTGLKVDRPVPMVPSTGWSVIPDPSIFRLRKVMVVDGGNCGRASAAAMSFGITCSTHGLKEF